MIKNIRKYSIMIEVLFDPMRINFNSSLGMNNSICKEYLKNIGGSKDRKASLHRILGA
jgi:hypothetical protein